MIPSGETPRTFRPASLLLLGLGLLAQPPASAPKPPVPIPGASGTLVRPDLVLHYRTLGQGEPVLVLTGGPGFPGGLMEPVAQMIAKKGRAILPDPRGSGRSMPKEDAAITVEGSLSDFEALRNELGLKQWTVLGCSWGGMLALDYAAKFPGSLKALVLLDSGGTSWASFGQAFGDNITCRMTAEERAARRFWYQKEEYARNPQRAELELLRCILPAYFYDRSKALPFLAGLKEGKESYNPAAGRMDAEYDKGEGARIEALAKMRLPALILHGRQDPLPEAVAMDLNRLLRGSRLILLDRCGHLAWLEQPDALEKALLEFLEEVK